jgi:hypothetical protein
LKILETEELVQINPNKHIQYAFFIKIHIRSDGSVFLISPQPQIYCSHQNIRYIFKCLPDLPNNLKYQTVLFWKLLKLFLFIYLLWSYNYYIFPHQEKPSLSFQIMLIYVIKPGRRNNWWVLHYSITLLLPTTYYRLFTTNSSNFKLFKLFKLFKWSIRHPVFSGLFKPKEGALTFRAPS